VHSYECPFGPSMVKLTAHHNQLLWFCSNGLLLKQEQRVETSQLPKLSRAVFLIETGVRRGLLRRTSMFLISL
jgi:hypothetical protein